MERTAFPVDAVAFAVTFPRGDVPPETVLWVPDGVDLTVRHPLGVEQWATSLEHLMLLEDRLAGGDPGETPFGHGGVTVARDGDELRVRRRGFCIHGEPSAVRAAVGDVLRTGFEWLAARGVPPDDVGQSGPLAEQGVDPGAVWDRVRDAPSE